MNFLSMIWHTFGVMTNQGLKLEEVDIQGGIITKKGSNNFHTIIPK
jgi:hypothetical protein